MGVNCVVVPADAVCVCGDAEDCRHSVCVLVVMLQELRNAHSEEIMGIRREEEMEMSDDDLDENPCKKMRVEENGTMHQC